MERLDKKPIGVIEALSQGFELVIQHPWVLWAPIALDLFLWLGPQLTAQHVFQQMASLLSGAAAQNATPDTQSSVASLQSALTSAGQTFNVFSMLALFAIGMPTFVGVSAPPGDFLGRTVLFSIADPTTLFVWIAFFALVGLLISSIYLEGVAGPIRSVRSGVRGLAGRLLKSYANIVGLVVLGAIAALVLMIPFAIGAAIFSTLNQGLGFFFLIVGSFVLLWGALYLAFAVPAIFVSGASFPQAVLNSITIFRYNFWSAIGLILLVYLLQFGFSVIWEQLLGSAMGIVVDVAANAFLGTGLIAAVMVFYQDRFSWLTEVRERIRQQGRPSLKG